MPAPKMPTTTSSTLNTKAGGYVEPISLYGFHPYYLGLIPSGYVGAFLIGGVGGGLCRGRWSYFFFGFGILLWACITGFWLWGAVRELREQQREYQHESK